MGERNLVVWCQNKLCNNLIDGTHCCHENAELDTNAKCLKFEPMKPMKKFSEEVPKSSNEVEYFIEEQFSHLGKR